MDFHKPGPNKRDFAFLIGALIVDGLALLLSFTGIKIRWLV